MTEDKLRNQVGKQILFFGIGVFVLVFVGYATLGIDSEELSVLLPLLAPIHVVYLGGYFKYAIDNRELKSDKKVVQVNPLFTRLTHVFIPSHFILLVLLLVGKFFNTIDFDTLKIAIGIVESMFGIYTGMIVSVLFKVEEKSA
jgi:hypothetical protein